MSDREDNDSDAPEELTAEQGLRQDEELRKIQTENKIRVKREGKERRKLWSKRKTPKKAKLGCEEDIDAQEVVDGGATYNDQDEDTAPHTLMNKGMLPNDIVKLLAAREKQVFSSDSEDENDKEKSKSRRKKHKSSSGSGPIILKEIPAPQCLQASMEFLKKRKMQVQRSNSVLTNANRALRLISGSGLLNTSKK